MMKESEGGGRRGMRRRRRNRHLERTLLTSCMMLPISNPSISSSVNKNCPYRVVSIFGLQQVVESRRLEAVFETTA